MTFISINIIAYQNSYHNDKLTQQCLPRVVCPQLIRNVRTRRRIDSSIIGHPINFDMPREGSLKKIIYRYNPLDNHMDFLYRHTTNHVSTLSCLNVIRLYLMVTYLTEQEVDKGVCWVTLEYSANMLTFPLSHYRIVNVGDYFYTWRIGASDLKLTLLSSTWDCTTFHNFLSTDQC